MELQQLTKEQRAELKAQLNAQDEQEKKQRKDDIDAYKALISDAINKSFVILQEQSQQLAIVKSQVYKMFNDAFAMKEQLFKTKENGQFSHTFTNSDSTRRIVLGCNQNDEYDDTANNGIEMVNEYLDELSSSPDAAQAVKICRSLLARDKKGTLKPARIMTLRKHAIESGNKKFIEGVDIIMEAYKPTPSKQYIRAEFKDEKGEWTAVPLGMTEAE